jgi:hypothetical protein
MQGARNEERSFGLESLVFLTLLVIEARIVQ